MVSYDELNEEEKQKDRDQVIQALKLNKEISKGSIKIEDLSKKYVQYLAHAIDNTYLCIVIKNKHRRGGNTVTSATGI